MDGGVKKGKGVTARHLGREEYRAAVLSYESRKELKWAEKKKGSGQDVSGKGESSIYGQPNIFFLEQGPDRCEKEREGGRGGIGRRERGPVVQGKKAKEHLS